MWVQNNLSECKQHTEVQGAISNHENVTFGVPPGCTLGPKLFSIHAYDLPASVKSGNVEMYADDTTIFCLCWKDEVSWKLQMLFTRTAHINILYKERNILYKGDKMLWEEYVILLKRNIGPELIHSFLKFWTFLLTKFSYV